MRKHILLLLLILFSTFEIFAQISYSIQGKIVDTMSTLTLKNALVTVLHAKDSVFADYSRARDDGGFVFNKLETGKYILIATYPNYIDFVERFTLDSSNREVDLGVINMFLVSGLLSEVVITAKNAITIKGDTIEFDASKYTIHQNSRVEDLLVQFPGFQVDMNGKIIAYGETVRKVLVEGEEFFGDDPTLVTKNIRADMVDKIQLYDKKSDQAVFTGMDDGEKTKTINIQLREDSKNGMFGKVEGGRATGELHQEQAVFNAFRDNRKIAAYGTIANTGKTGLGEQDSDRFVGEASVMDFDSFGGNYGGQGIPFTRNGGVHYDIRWNDKKESINANYKIGDIEVMGNRETFSQNSLPTEIIKSDASDEFKSYAFRHKLDARYELEFDKTSKLMITVDGTTSNSWVQNELSSFTLDGEDELLNQSNRKASNEGGSQSFTVNALWNKKLRKKGRTISLQVNQNLNSDDMTGYLFSENEFFGSGVLDSTQIIDQQKRRNSERFLFSSNVAYTEPLSEVFKLAVNYRFKAQNSTSRLLSYNQFANGKYNGLDSLFSNDFKLNEFINEAGATLNYEKEKNVISLGMKVLDINFKQIDRFQDDILRRSFVNLNPNARWTYKVSSQKSLNLNYSGNTMQPAVNQIQPLRNNEDPLNIAVGNPSLDPAFGHNMGLTYSSFKMLSNQIIFIVVNASTIDNEIVSNVFIDEVGRSIYSYENLKSKNPMRLSFIASYGSEIKSMGIKVAGNIAYSKITQYNIVNAVLNRISTNITSVNFDIGKNKKDKYSFKIAGGPVYDSNTASLQEAYSNRGWGFKGNANFRLFLSGKFELSSDAQYLYSAATHVFAEDFERLIWNAAIRKKFLKTKDLVLSLYVNDILNQNVGFRRYANSTGFTQTDYTTIQRYFMVSLTWDFNRMGNKG